jgi:Cu/Ag efflux protein CusF
MISSVRFRSLARLALPLAAALLAVPALPAQHEGRAVPGSSAPAPAAGHPLRGVVTRVLADKQLVLVKHEEIPGFMMAMTMAFHVPPEIYPALTPGTRIAATLLPKQPDGWHLVAVRLLADAGATLAPALPHRVALAADPKNPGAFSGTFTFVAPTSGDWRANVGTRAAWVDIAPKGGAPLTSKACSHANPPGFAKGPLYTLVAGQPYEVRVTKVPAPTLDVLLQPFVGDAPAAPAQSR